MIKISRVRFGFTSSHVSIHISRDGLGMTFRSSLFFFFSFQHETCEMVKFFFSFLEKAFLVMKFHFNPREESNLSKAT